METCNEVVYMRESSVRDVVYVQICRLRILVERVWRRRDETATRRELSALSPWLKKDLGIGHDGRLLDRRT